ncbi:MAG: hypothetical protein LBT42_05385 [Tannerella sp.]|nr:hypothetical protein [Tannerella sp.]
MKTKLFLFTAAMLLFSGCTKRDGITVDDIYWFVETYTIRENQWQLVNGVNQLNSYYQAQVNIPELDRKIYESGNVFCYMYQNIDGTEVQTLLPFTLPVGIDNGDGTETLWTETYACDFSVGSVMFYVNYSDFITENKPKATKFRVVLNY